MGVKDRLDLIIRELGVSGRQFARACGLSESYYPTINDGIGADKLNKIISVYPKISVRWLITGEGKMWQGEAGKSENSEKLIDYLREKDKKIEELLQENMRLKITLGHDVPTSTNESIVKVLSRLEEKIDKKGESADNAGAVVG